MKFIAFIFILTLALTGCVSVQQEAATRTDRLRVDYPPGTSKQAVQSRWGQTRPDYSTSRPSSGWAAHPNSYVAKKLESAEARTGKRIDSVDRYWGLYTSMSLCYCWYFYDSSEKIVDVEWQYKSD
jgi:hypothetical protein